MNRYTLEMTEPVWVEEHSIEVEHWVQEQGEDSYHWYMVVGAEEVLVFDETYTIRRWMMGRESVWWAQSLSHGEYAMIEDYDEAEGSVVDLAIREGENITPYTEFKKL